MTHDVEIDEWQRQLILIALATLSIERPGWHAALRETAARFPGSDLYERFRTGFEDLAAKVGNDPKRLQP